MFISILPAAEHLKETAFVIALVLLGIFTLLEIVVMAAIVKIASVKHLFAHEFSHNKHHPARKRHLKASAPNTRKAAEARTVSYKVTILIGLIAAALAALIAYWVQHR